MASGGGLRLFALRVAHVAARVPASEEREGRTAEGGGEAIGPPWKPEEVGAVSRACAGRDRAACLGGRRERVARW